MICLASHSNLITCNYTKKYHLKRRLRKHTKRAKYAKKHIMNRRRISKKFKRLRIKRA